MTKTKRPQSTLAALFDGETVRHIVRDGETYFAVTDVIRVLADGEDPYAQWDDMRRREPALKELTTAVDLPAETGLPETVDAVTAEGMLRLVQSIPSAKAEKLRLWLARSAKQKLDELQDPELALGRLRKEYEAKGYSRRWIDKRLRGMSARQELVAEWYRRGVTDSDQYRALTNLIVEKAFGMDVNAYRRYKNLDRPAENLRDHMTDLELVLTTLGETAAVALHRRRDSRGVDALAADATDAGEIAAAARTELEKRGGQPVVTS